MEMHKIYVSGSTRQVAAKLRYVRYGGVERFKWLEAGQNLKQEAIRETSIAASNLKTHVSAAFGGHLVVF